MHVHAACMRMHACVKVIVQGRDDSSLAGARGSRKAIDFPDFPAHLCVMCEHLLSNVGMNHVNVNVG